MVDFVSFEKKTQANSSMHLVWVYKISWWILKYLNLFVVYKEVCPTTRNAVPDTVVTKKNNMPEEYTCTIGKL